MAETGGRGSRPGELYRRRVVLLDEGTGLAAVLNHLLDPTDRLSRIGSLRELAESRALDSADVVVLDMPVEDRADAFGQIRRRFLGPVVVLVAKGDKGGGYLDDAATLLTRPFSTEELGAALAVLGRPASPSPWFSTLAALSIEAGPPAAASTAVGTPAPPAEAPSGRLDLVDRVQRLRITLTQGWQARRRIRVAGFSAFALVAFTVAFALASQGGCGPGCDAFGTGFSPAPTIAPAESRAPSTTGPKRSTTTTAGSLGTSAARGISDGRPATTTTARRATTTTVKPTGGSSGTTMPTRPPTTLPPTTQAPTTVPTTQPPTTTAPPVD